MKVLHIVSGELNSGAARGALWLHEALIDSGVDSKILLPHIDGTKYETIEGFFKNEFFKKVSLTLKSRADTFIFECYDKQEGTHFSAGLFGCALNLSQAVRDADIIHLHWINGGYLNISTLGKFNKPIVWSIRDMWPLTGGCHYSLGCENFKRGCGSCPQLNSKNPKDVTNYLSTLKNRTFSRLDIHPVGISNWVSDQVAQSSIMQGVKVRTIFNTVDSNKFSPQSKKESKEYFGFDSDLPIVLIGANNIKDYYKGFSLFTRAIELLINQNDMPFQVVSFGKYNRDIEQLPFHINQIGFIEDDLILSKLYSSADVFVAPSIFEAFGKTVAESMSCGTPVVAFNNTGPVDIIDHKVNGYLATYNDINDLANGIRYLIKQRPGNIEQKSIESIKQKFSPRLIADKYICLYKELV